jgi:predicted transcriptional regulator
MPARLPSLGPLEIRVLETLWTRREPATVKDIQSAFPRLAYTTVMTTLERLHRKGLLLRAKRGRAYEYSVQCSREQFLADLAFESLAASLLEGGSRRPILSMFVDAVGRHDGAILDELEAIVHAARTRQRRDDR